MKNVCRSCGSRPKNEREDIVIHPLMGSRLIDADLEEYGKCEDCGADIIILKKELVEDTNDAPISDPHSTLSAAPTSICVCHQCIELVVLPNGYDILVLPITDPDSKPHKSQRHVPCFHCGKTLLAPKKLKINSDQVAQRQQDEPISTENLSNSTNTGTFRFKEWPDEDSLFFEKAYKSICEMQIEKNRRYQGAALSPLDIFAKHHPYGTRIDEKLARVKASKPGQLRKNDIADIIGSCMLLCKSFGWDDFSDLID